MITPASVAPDSRAQKFLDKLNRFPPCSHERVQTLDNILGENNDLTVGEYQALAFSEWDTPVGRHLAAEYLDHTYIEVVYRNHALTQAFFELVTRNLNLNADMVRTVMKLVEANSYHKGGLRQFLVEVPGEALTAEVYSELFEKFKPPEAGPRRPGLQSKYPHAKNRGLRRASSWIVYNLLIQTAKTRYDLENLPDEWILELLADKKQSRNR